MSDWGWYIALGLPLLLLLIGGVARKLTGTRLAKGKPTPKGRGSYWGWLFSARSNTRRPTVRRRSSGGGGGGE